MLLSSSEESAGRQTLLPGTSPVPVAVVLVPDVGSRVGREADRLYYSALPVSVHRPSRRPHRPAPPPAGPPAAARPAPGCAADAAWSAGTGTRSTAGPGRPARATAPARAGAATAAPG